MTIVGKKHWLKITLLVLAVCAVAGLVLSVILFNQNPGRTYASASLQFSFNGAGILFNTFVDFGLDCSNIFSVD